MERLRKVVLRNGLLGPTIASFSITYTQYSSQDRVSEVLDAQELGVGGGRVGWDGMCTGYWNYFLWLPGNFPTQSYYPWGKQKWN